MNEPSVVIVLRESEVNHLRRLLGWVECTVVGTDLETVEDVTRQVRAFTESVGELTEEGGQRLDESLYKARHVPKYVRAAMKALKPIVRQSSAPPAEVMAIEATQ